MEPNISVCHKSHLCHAVSSGVATSCVWDVFSRIREDLRRGKRARSLFCTTRPDSRGFEVNKICR